MPLNTRDIYSLCDLGIHWKEQEQITDWDLDYEFKHQTVY